MYYLLTFIFIFDQLIKFFVIHLMEQGESISVIQKIFHLTYVTNTGVAFGLFRHQKWMITALSVFIILLIIFFKEKLLKNNRRYTSIFLGLILGGALGNLVDRLRFSYVIDYLDFRIWPVFNLADTCICLGVIGFILCTLFYSKKVS